MLLDKNHAFVIVDCNRGETDLIQMRIDTGDATPRIQSVHHTPFAARQEIAKHL